MPSLQSRDSAALPPVWILSCSETGLFTFPPFAFCQLMFGAMLVALLDAMLCKAKETLSFFEPQWQYAQFTPLPMTM